MKTTFVRLTPFALRVGLAILSCAPAASAAPDSEPPRIVTVGGPLTELVFALGAGGQVVGVDTSSLFPPSVMSLPKVGYQRAVSAEGVLSLRPDVVLAGEEAGPPAALDQLRAAGLVVTIVPVAQSRATLEATITQVAAALGRRAAGEAMVDSVRADLERAVAWRRAETAPRVLFVYARGAGSLLVAGGKTTPQALIELAGGVNAVAEFDGFRPLSAESAVLADPDVILVSRDGLKSLGGVEGLLALPGIDRTRAAAARRVAELDDAFLLGFGPRLGEAVSSLVHQLHPEVRD